MAPKPQLSASGPQGAQVDEDLRQFATLVGMHWPFKQQPEGHELPLQVHALPLQLWPRLQLGPVPHRHAPAGPQAFAR